MPKTRTITVYAFKELDDTAKEKARDWYRSVFFEFDWWDHVYDDAKECAAVIGINIDRIYFSGFSSQGDGACFEGSYCYATHAPEKIREHAPKDTTLHAIADALEDTQQSWHGSLEARVKQSGHYSHEYCTDIDVSDACEDIDSSRSIVEAEERLINLLRDYMRWIYSQLQTEYDYLNADDQIDESITVNDYEFNQDGTVA